MELSPVFARRLYLALLVESLERPNVPKLIEKTGWPRRTIQDVIKAMPGIGIELNFVQDGRRHTMMATTSFLTGALLTVNGSPNAKKTLRQA
ncbi:hypothetical protein VCSRO122_0748 [Vibrio cholerae]|nr:hypothetical protein VCSRO122_0748 [Vibrio cholerae]